MTLVPCACGLCKKFVDPATQTYFQGHHNKKYDSSLTIVCGCGCGRETKARDCYGNPRKFVPGHGYKARSSAAIKRRIKVTVFLAGPEKTQLMEKANGRKLGTVLREEALREAV